MSLLTFVLIGLALFTLTPVAAITYYALKLRSLRRNPDA